jgi:hypothetical protein
MEGVTVPLEAVLHTPDGEYRLCLGKPAHRLAQLKASLVHHWRLPAGPHELLGCYFRPPSWVTNDDHW